MKNLIKPRWLSGPPICSETHLPAFVSEAAAREWAATLPGIDIKSIKACPHCEGWHTQGTGRPSRNDTLRIPAAAQKHNEILSSRRR